MNYNYINPHIKEFCDKYNITENQYHGNDPLNKTITIENDSWPEDFKPTDGKIIYNSIYNGYLTNLTSLNVDVEFNINLNLYLSNLENIHTYIKFNVGYDLNLYNLKEIHKDVIFNVGCDLNLQSLKSIDNNIEFNVGGYLNLYNLKEIHKDVIFNVYNINLYNLEFITKNIIFNIGGNLNLNKLKSPHPPKIPFNNIFESNREKYIILNNILGKIIRHKQKVYKIKKNRRIYRRICSN